MIDATRGRPINYAARQLSAASPIFQKGDFSIAADFLRSIELDKTSGSATRMIKDAAYPMQWRYLARGRAGESGAAELAAHAARLKTK